MALFDSLAGVFFGPRLCTIIFVEPVTGLLGFSYA